MKPIDLGRTTWLPKARDKHGDGWNNNQHCRQHTEAAHHQRRIVETDGLPGQDNPPALPGCRSQRNEAAQKVPPVGAPALVRESPLASSSATPRQPYRQRPWVAGSRL